MRNCVIRGQLAEHKQNKDKFFETIIILSQQGVKHVWHHVKSICLILSLELWISTHYFLSTELRIEEQS